MQPNQQNLLALLRWMMALCAALPLALFIFAASVSYITNRDDADRQILRSLDVAHEHALKVFETIDRSLSEMNEIVRDLPDGDIKRDEEKLHARLKQLANSLPQMKSAWIFDAQGRALVNSLVYPAPSIDFSDRDYFRALAEEARGTYIGPTLTPRLPYMGPAFFSVSQRRTNESGKFNGVVQASVLPDYFENFYERIGHDAGSFFALVRPDGKMLARFPMAPGDGARERTGSIGQEIAEKPQGGLVTLVSIADGIERRIGYQKLAEYPVYVAAGLETSAIRSHWLTTIASYLIFGLPATILLFVILGLALHRTHRLYFETAKRMEAEEQLKHGQRLEALGQLTGGVAHDFNNLLTVIRSSTDLLRRPNLTEARRERYIEAISNTVDRAAKLTAQLLAFARRQTLKPEVFDVGHSVQGIGDIIGTLVGSPVTIATRIPEEPCYVNTDLGQFETALINMAVNARDAMPHGGKLTISVRVVASAPGGTVPTDADDYVAVSVEDTGGGIAPDVMDRIFEPFFTTKNVGQGTGLGLSQVFGFAKQSGGEMVAESELGHGSTFTLYLPRASHRDLPQQPVQRLETASGKRIGLSVLVVEDNPDVGSFAATALRESGFTVTLATNGADALTELDKAAARYDVVFTDVVMPGMTGIELAREVKRRYPRLPVVLTSGYSQELSRFGNQGFELVQKPYAIEPLSQMLRRVAQAAKVEASAAE